MALVKMDWIAKITASLLFLLRRMEKEMTNVSSTPAKVAIRSLLFKFAKEALERQGWKVERIARSGKSSLRRITKGKLDKTVSIRTSQDTWIAFPRTNEDDAWATLSDVDYVVASSVDDPHNPKFAQVHMIAGDEMRARFDRAYAARKQAGHVLPVGRGIWLSLYEKEASTPVSLVGGGIGLDNPAIARVSLSGQEVDVKVEEQDSQTFDEMVEEGPLTIAEAKRRLAKSLGVAESDVRITVSS